MMISDRDLSKIFHSPVEPFNHFSACGHLAAHVGKIVNDLNLLELGTGYGLQLPHVVPHFNKSVSIDVMYDWVPDIQPTDPFDPSKIDKKKLDCWIEASKPWKDKTFLILGNTYHVCKQDPELISRHGKFDVLIVDGCHHPAESVELDFWNHVEFMNDEYFAIFDDVNETDCHTAASNVMKKLHDSGHQITSRYNSTGNIQAILMHVKSQKPSTIAPESTDSSE